jgi:FlaA1/EpsC-like NDP-sugar epimerase
MDIKPDSFFWFSPISGKDEPSNAVEILKELVQRSNFLILGAAGTIGQIIINQYIININNYE